MKHYGDLPREATRFEGQLFNITRKQMLPDVLSMPAGDPSIRFYGDCIIGIFLLGGTAGGLLFGCLADRIGRRPAMVATILMYSLFSGMTYLATTWWHVALLRFLVAMGVGGEWAVGAALVAEVFPARARAHASGIFHASSVLGTWGATLTGLAVGSQWRLAYLVGVAPALLVLLVRAFVQESPRWQQARSSESDGDLRPSGSLRDLLFDPVWSRRALKGMALAAVGLATFWSVTVAGQDLAQEMAMRQGVPQEKAVEQAKFAYGIVETTGGGLGLLCFGPLTVWLGRRRAFVLMHVGALVIVPITCYLPRNTTQQL
jgi:MFS family permease